MYWVELFCMIAFGLMILFVLYIAVCNMFIYLVINPIKHYRKKHFSTTEDLETLRDAIIQQRKVVSLLSMEQIVLIKTYRSLMRRMEDRND